MSETCPHCGSTELIRKGYRKTKTLGKRPIRRCRACTRKFTASVQEARPDETRPREEYSANCASLPGSAWGGP